MDERVLNSIDSLFGKMACRIKVGGNKNLSIGFGEKKFHENKLLNTDHYGEWEAGCFYCAWRIMKGNNILYGSDDPIEDLEKLDINGIDLGKLNSIDMISDIDIKLNFDSGIKVYFFATISDNDEYFHIFCPDHKYVELAAGGLWSICESNKPFNRSEDAERQA